MPIRPLHPLLMALAHSNPLLVRIGNRLALILRKLYMRDVEQWHHPEIRPHSLNGTMSQIRNVCYVNISISESLNVDLTFTPQP